MSKCFECSSDVTAADQFCPNCGIRLPSDDATLDPSLEATIIVPKPVRAADASPEPPRGEVATPPAAAAEDAGYRSDAAEEIPIAAEIFSVEEAEEEAPLQVESSQIGQEDEDPGEYRPSGDFRDSDLAHLEEEVEIGPSSVAIVSVEGDVEEDSGVIEAEPEDFLPDDLEDGDLVADLGSGLLVAEIEEEVPVEFEEGSEVVIEVTSDLRQQTIVPPGAIPEASPVQNVPEDPGTSVVPVPSTGGGGRASKLQPLREGAVLAGRYEIVRKIGGGGMGAVYLASDRNLGGAPRAVKEMVQSYIEGEQQEKAVSDFKRESLLLTTLDHQSIPTIYDYFFDDSESRFYLVMKYISGGDLAGRLRAAPEGRFEERIVTEWAAEIADVLDYLHRHDPPIVYRDLKPANVMIDGNSGRVMLIDFGIARWINKEEKGVTAVGTMGYAPPELFSGNVEPRSDIYSLGSTMFHLLTGADPQSNPLLIFDFDKNPKPRQINPQLSEQMEAILMRAVEYNVNGRFNSAAEMREALLRHLDDMASGRLSFGQPIPSPTEVAEKVFCGFCGKPILPTDMFCAYCGNQQTSIHGVTAPTFRPTVGVVRLLLLGSGALDFRGFVLEKDVNLVGRRDPGGNIFPEVDLSKFDPTTKISRRHAQITRTPAGFVIEDLGSSNGTFVIREGAAPVRLSKGQMHDLKAGDRIRLGDTTLQFVLE